MRRYLLPLLLLALAIYLHVWRLPDYKGQGDEKRKYYRLYHK